MRKVESRIVPINPNEIPVPERLKIYDTFRRTGDFVKHSWEIFRRKDRHTKLTLSQTRSHKREDQLKDRNSLIQRRDELSLREALNTDMDYRDGVSPHMDGQLVDLMY